LQSLSLVDVFGDGKKRWVAKEWGELRAPGYEDGGHGWVARLTCTDTLDKEGIVRYSNWFEGFPAHE
jgi:hypothetical protein